MYNSVSRKVSPIGDSVDINLKGNTLMSLCSFLYVPRFDRLSRTRQPYRLLEAVSVYGFRAGWFLIATAVFIGRPLLRKRRFVMGWY